MAFSEFDRVRLQYDEKHWRVNIPIKWIELMVWEKGDLIQLGLSKKQPTIPPIVGLVNISKVDRATTAEHIKAAFNLMVAGIGIEPDEFRDWWIEEAEKMKSPLRKVKK